MPGTKRGSEMIVAPGEIVDIAVLKVIVSKGRRQRAGGSGVGICRSKPCISRCPHEQVRRRVLC